ncbi:hypothetical protein EVAR_64940_1 [Eumeta japonica]|uniref:Uncharacterized protein n=1 Tax=Eumeta variegata TaxID=151549 RepID=A0A4C1ZD20_EUMVA|nr:hypothetical protein EVAR_64940_1 [Eumeta japonica]
MDKCDPQSDAKGSVPQLRLGVTYEKGVTLGNVTMSHRTRERPAECLASLSHSTMIGHYLKLEEPKVRIRNKKGRDDEAREETYIGKKRVRCWYYVGFGDKKGRNDEAREETYIGKKRVRCWYYVGFGNKKLGAKKRKQGGDKSVQNARRLSEEGRGG